MLALGKLPHQIKKTYTKCCVEIELKISKTRNDSATPKTIEEQSW